MQTEELCRVCGDPHPNGACQEIQSKFNGLLDRYAAAQRDLFDKKFSSQENLRQNLPLKKIEFIMSMYLAGSENITLREINTLLEEIIAKDDVVKPEVLDALMQRFLQLRILFGEYTTARKMFSQFVSTLPQRSAALGMNMYRMCILKEGVPETETDHYWEGALVAGDPIETLAERKNRFEHWRENKDDIKRAAVHNFAANIFGAYKHFPTEVGDELVDFVQHYVPDFTKSDLLEEKKRRETKSAYDSLASEKNVSVRKAVEDANMAFRRGNETVAFRIIADALSTYPDIWELWQKQFAFALAAQRKDLAQQTLDEQKRRFPHADARLLTGNEERFNTIFVRLPVPASATKQMSDPRKKDRHVDNTIDITIQKERVQELWRIGRRDEAFESLTFALIKYPRNIELLQLQLNLAIKDEREDLARNSLITLRAIIPDNTDYLSEQEKRLLKLRKPENITPAAINQRRDEIEKIAAWIDGQENEYKEGKEMLYSALRRNPENPDLLVIACRAALREGDEGAVSAFLKKMQTIPSVDSTQLRLLQEEFARYFKKQPAPKFATSPVLGQMETRRPVNRLAGKTTARSKK